MPTLQIRFPAGRYHATPAGAHVNEGQIEWPPSPWRILRALIACGFNTQHWKEVPDAARRMIERLASVAPRYSLPPVSMSHSRHYMPIGGLDGHGREKTTLIFDTWAHIADNEVVVRWDCELEDEEHQLLSRLTECLGYLGRSESWIEAKLVHTTAAEFNALPHDQLHDPGYGWEQVHVLAPTTPVQYANWLKTVTDSVLESLPLPDDSVKPTSKAFKNASNARAKALEPYPHDLVDCLTKDTAWWKERRWAAPPGSQPILYWRRSDQLRVSPPQEFRRSKPLCVSAMLLAMTTESGNRASLPPIERSLPQAELLHRQLVGIVNKLSGHNCPELTGCDDRRRPLRTPHQHAHILPLDLDGDLHLDHILIHAPMGLGPIAQQAIHTLTRTYAKNLSSEIQLAVAGSGCVASILETLKYKTIVSSGSTWTSVTPMVMPRFVKRSGKNTLEGQVQAELASRCLPPASSIEVLPKESIGFRHFVRTRTHSRKLVRPPVDTGFALRLHFSAPLLVEHLPLSLGYASHFGLGLFMYDATTNQ